jgi:hypothetical protein
VTPLGEGCEDIIARIFTIFHYCSYSSTLPQIMFARVDANSLFLLHYAVELHYTTSQSTEVLRLGQSVFGEC